MKTRTGSPPIGRRQGFALVPALFLIVVLGALAVFAVRIGAGQQQTVVMGLQAARALSAASTGVEWGAYRALNGSCAASTTLALTEGALNGYSVVVTCTSKSFANGASTANSYVINSSATLGTYGQPGYVHRTVSGTFTNAP